MKANEERVYLVVRHEEFVGYCIEEDYSRIFDNFYDAWVYVHELNDSELFDDDFSVMELPFKRTK